MCNVSHLSFIIVSVCGGSLQFRKQTTWLQNSTQLPQASLCCPVFSGVDEVFTECFFQDFFGGESGVATQQAAPAAACC